MKKTLGPILLAMSCSLALSACCTIKEPCEELAQYAEENKELNAISHFAFDSAELAEEDKPALDEFAAFLNDNPNVKAHVDGFTDHMGSQAYNLALGLRRAESVSQYLQEKGIERERIEVQSYGADKFVDESKTVAANALNRRAVIYVEEQEAA